MTLTLCCNTGISEMKQNFPNNIELDSDIYISDYTNFTGNAPVKGVDITNELNDIFNLWPPLHISNPNRVPILVANMERNPAVNKRKDGTPCKQCECLCISTQCAEDDVPWFALVELKCCQDVDRNIRSNIENALFKLKKHHLHLRDEKSIITKGMFHYYWIISIPTSDRPPFMRFLFSQDNQLTLGEKFDGAQIIGDNDIFVVDGSEIKGQHKETFF